MDRPPSRESGARQFRICDCDVHPVVESGLESVHDYMPEPWRQRFVRKRARVGVNALSLKYQHPNGFIDREDAQPPSGSPTGSDPEFLVHDLIERNDIDLVVLNSLQAASLCAALAGTDESRIIASAFNAFFLDRWLPVDARLRLAMTVPSQDPAAAAAEIRRIGGHRQIAAVALPMLNILLGNRYWWPVYEAAHEAGLPILLHVSGTESIYQGVPIASGGIPDSYVERYVTLVQPGESNLNSLIFSGVFERYPGLKFVFVEFGFLWALPLVWRMDRTWRQLRHEVPWVRKSPIEYLHQHCRFTTQPIDEPANPRDLETMIALFGYDHLCFSTDYPHWDNDMPGAVLQRLPSGARRKVFFDNAAATFRL